MGKRPGRTVRLGVLRFDWDGVNDRIVTQPDGDVLPGDAHIHLHLPASGHANERVRLGRIRADNAGVTARSSRSRIRFNNFF